MSRGVVAEAEPSTGKERSQVDMDEMVDQSGGADVRDISEAGQTAVVTEAEVDQDAFKVEWWRPAFTRRREIFMARTAMAGFLSLQVGEILTGEGFFGQLSAITGWPKPVLGVFLLVTVANNAITGLHPRSPTFSAGNQADIGKRNKLGAAQFISKPGFTKRNELNLGRLAMCGWAAALIGEVLTGKGPAGQLGLQMESPLVRGGSLVLLLTWLAFWFVVARQLGTEGQLKGDTEIY